MVVVKYCDMAKASFVQFRSEIFFNVIALLFSSKAQTVVSEVAIISETRLIDHCYSPDGNVVFRILLNEFNCVFCKCLEKFDISLNITQIEKSILRSICRQQLLSKIHRDLAVR